MSTRAPFVPLRSGALLAACALWVTAPHALAQGESEDPFERPSSGPPSDPPRPNSETPARLLANLPADTPAYFRKSYLSLMRAPLPRRIYDQGGIPQVVPRLQLDRNPSGTLGTFRTDGPTVTARNAFFQPLGTNGRSCVTCHQPPSGMSVSVRNIRARLEATGGSDPIFAPVDGANCPNQVPAEDTSGSLDGGWKGEGKAGHDFEAAHSLLLGKGLIRIPLPVPADAEYTLEVVSDPTTCNLDPGYSSLPDGTRIVSVFRRPLISTNLSFKTSTIPFGPPSPITNIMFDGREPTLFTQAVSATMGHAQALAPPTQEQLEQIVELETRIFSAQLHGGAAGRLDAAGAKGGPVHLSDHRSDAPAFVPVAFDEFDAWADVRGPGEARRESIFRGQQLFHGVGGASGDRGAFTISDVAGFNDAIGVPAITGSCATCHNFAHGGSDIFAAAQRDIGIGGQAPGIGGPLPATDLPIFKLTCPAGSFLWDPALTTVTTNDPGKALITGRCRDVGARTVPSLRALAAHEPYFSDGSAATLRDLVNVYDERFAIGLTGEEKQDLVNFLNAL
jgi:hypothetical protein